MHKQLYKLNYHKYNCTFCGKNLKNELIQKIVPTYDNKKTIEINPHRKVVYYKHKILVGMGANSPIYIERGDMLVLKNFKVEHDSMIPGGIILSQDVVCESCRILFLEFIYLTHGMLFHRGMMSRCEYEAQRKAFKTILNSKDGIERMKKYLANAKWIGE